MEIKIKLTKSEANHLKSPHTFIKYPKGCDWEKGVMHKVQKEIDKQLKRENG